MFLRSYNERLVQQDVLSMQRCVAQWLTEIMNLKKVILKNNKKVKCTV